MKIFITGATGYIGGSVGVWLASQGHDIRGLCRDSAKASSLETLGIHPVVGTLQDERLLERQAREADAVINAADSDNAYAVESLLAGLIGSGKIFIQISGSSVVGDRAAGAFGPRTFNEDIPRPVRWEKLGRCEIDREVLRAAAREVRSVVLCPCMIYGRGLGLHRESIQIPRLIATARKGGAARYIGSGLNVWSTVHIEDVVAAVALAFERAPAGSFFFLENGQIDFLTLAQTVQTGLGLTGEPKSWTAEEAALEWGQEGAHFAFGSNSRVSSAKARALLGWKPTRDDIVSEVKRSICDAWAPHE